MKLKMSPQKIGILYKQTMKKIIYITTLIIIAGCGTSKIDNNNVQNSYYPISGMNANFKYANSDSYVFHKDLNKTESKNEKIYTVREIQYSWGKKTETLYRLENTNVMYFDTQSGTENMIMPSKPKVGFKWQSIDKAWEYEIVNMNADLETPTKKYSGLLLMKASQILNRDADKLKNYLNYYEKGTGKIASFGNGELMTYRLE